MMTISAAVLGALPLIYAHGAGAESRLALGWGHHRWPRVRDALHFVPDPCRLPHPGTVGRSKSGGNAAAYRRTQGRAALIDVSRDCQEFVDCRLPSRNPTCARALQLHLCRTFAPTSARTAPARTGDDTAPANGVLLTQGCSRCGQPELQEHCRRGASEYFPDAVSRSIGG